MKVTGLLSIGIFVYQIRPEISLNRKMILRYQSYHILLSMRQLHSICRKHDDVIKMETFSALLAICAGNSSASGELPAQRPVTRSFDIFFDLRLNKRLSKQSWWWWLEMPSCPLWRQCNGDIQLTCTWFPLDHFSLFCVWHVHKFEHKYSINVWPSNSKQNKRHEIRIF